MDDKTLKTTEASIKQEFTPEVSLEHDDHFYEVVKTIIIAVLIAISIRTFAYEPFSIPSGSMMPSLLVGDYLFVSKYSYGYSQHSFPWGVSRFDGRIFFSEPERGDVAVFKNPKDSGVDYIKRIIGLPGDRVRVSDGLLYINDKLAQRRLVGGTVVAEPFSKERTLRRYIQTLPNNVEHQIIERSDSESLDNTSVFHVPDGHYFVMGDNRDGSQDSRVIDRVGFIPAQNLVGRAEFIFFSVDEGSRAWQFWKWPWTVRGSRLFQRII